MLDNNIAVVEFAGPLVIMYMMSAALFATLTVQLYLYYQAFPKDNSFLKSTVYAVYALQLAQIILSAHDAFVIFGSGFGDVQNLTRVHATWATGPLSSALISFIVQCFYAYRLHVLSGHKLLSAVIGVGALVISVSGLVAAVFLLHVDDFTETNIARVSIPLGIYEFGAASIDILIAGFMAYYLMKSDTGFRDTHAVVVKLIRLVIETGSFTAFLALLTLAFYFAFPGRIFYLTPALLMSSAYANTMVASLNWRVRIVGGRSSRSNMNEATPPTEIKTVLVFAREGSLDVEARDRPF